MWSLLLLLSLAAGELAAGAPPTGASRDLLERASAKIVSDIHRLPNYTCVQTVSRSYSEDINPAVVLNRCDQMIDSIADREKSTLKLSWLDRLHFDIAVSQGKEIFSWAGDNRFQSDRNADFADEGAIGTGDFAGFITAIFGGHITAFEYKGRHPENGKDIEEFGYRVPQALSAYGLRIESKSFIVGFHGSFSIDPVTADLKRLTVFTDDAPAETKVCRADTSMDYEDIKIGNGNFILPRSTELIVFGTDGSKSDNRIVYSGCRQYLGESKIHFEEVADDATVTRVQKTITLPAGIEVDVRLQTRIDSETMMAGDAITGALTKPVKGSSGQVLLPRDAIVHGRIVRMQKRVRQHLYLVGLRFESVELPGASAALALSPVIGKDGGSFNKPGKGDLKAIDYKSIKNGTDSSGAGTFVFSGDQLVIPVGAVSRWTTRAPQK